MPQLQTLVMPAARLNMAAQAAAAQPEATELLEMVEVRFMAQAAAVLVAVLTAATPPVTLAQAA
jgi:hypothetical protein